MWWLLEEPQDSPLSGGYMAWGVHGQYVLVVPKRQMVIAHKRQVPVAGNCNVSWVGPVAFLRAARMSSLPLRRKAVMGGGFNRSMQHIR